LSGPERGPTNTHKQKKYFQLSPTQSIVHTILIMKKAVLILTSLSLASTTYALNLTNGSFEVPDVDTVDITGTGEVRYANANGIGNAAVQVDASDVTGWSTTNANNLIEVWETGNTPAYDGTNFAEINATEDSVLFQVIEPVAATSGGTEVNMFFAHRGRNGTDTMRITITDLGADGAEGGGDDTQLFTDTYSSDNASWDTTFIDGSVVGGLMAAPTGNRVLLQFASVSTAGGNPEEGNFLDAIELGQGVVPEPSTYALIFGALCLGYVIRRRKAKA